MAEASKTKSSTKIGAEAKKTTKKVVEETAEKPKKQDNEVVVEQQETVETQDTTAVEATTEEVKEKEVSAKAGKRSPKALKEADEKLAKTSRKAAQSSEASAKEEKPKKAVKPARSRLERRSKKYREAAKLIDKSKTYDLKEALELAAKSSPTKFGATVELHIRLNVDPKQADQNIRDSIVLPEGTGKTLCVAVFADEKDIESAKKAGADIAGAEQILSQLDKSIIDFDVLISTPAMMAKLGKYARVLGPKGLMPNPKSGTVTANVAKAVKEAKAGRVEYRVDSTGIIHVAVGKVSFGAEKLQNNTQALLSSLKASKPSSIKGAFIKSIYLTTTMGPSVPVNLSE